MSLLSEAIQPAIVSVSVTRLLPFGLLVQLPDGRAGIIREREIAWDHNAHRHWREHYQPGNQLEAIVLGEGRDQQLELSLRLAHHDPWCDLSTRYKLGQIVDGVVAGIQPYGVFVEIEPGITGLLHRSRLPLGVDEQHIMDLFWLDDQVKTSIEVIESEHRRLRLSILWPASQRWTAPIAPEPPTTEAPTPIPLPARLLVEQLLEQSAPLSILITQDNPVQLDANTHWLRQAGQHVPTASNAETALSRITSKHPDLVLMDFGLPGMNGIEALQHVLRYWPETRCMLMTDWARANEHLAELDQLRDQKVQLLLKPFLPEDLLSFLFDTLDQSSTSFQSVTPTPPAATLNSLHSDTAHLNQLLAQVRAATHAVKAVLFVLDPAQRSVCIAAEDGFRPLHEDALVDLIYSPVRDVAEDQQIMRVDDVRNVEARVRYLQPLLAFRSCLGVPLSSALRERYGLSLFWLREHSCCDVYETYAIAIAQHISALLERQQFQTRAIEMQRLALLGQLNRALIHEINHQLSPISFTLNDIHEQHAQVQRSLYGAPAAAAVEIHVAYATFDNLVKGVTPPDRDSAFVWQNDNSDPRAAAVCQHNCRGSGGDRARHGRPHPRHDRGQHDADASFSAYTDGSDLANRGQHSDQRHPADQYSRGRARGRIRICMEQEPRSECTVVAIAIEEDRTDIRHPLCERMLKLGSTIRSRDSSRGKLYITHSMVKTLGVSISPKARALRNRLCRRTTGS